MQFSDQYHLSEFNTHRGLPICYHWFIIAYPLHAIVMCWPSFAIQHELTDPTHVFHWHITLSATCV